MDEFSALFKELAAAISATLRSETVDVEGLRARIVHVKDQTGALADDAIQRARERAAAAIARGEAFVDRCQSVADAIERGDGEAALDALNDAMNALLPEEGSL